jgi:hypothetical protein
MKTCTVRIEGVSALLMHRFAMAEEDAKSKARDQKKNQDKVQEYLYLDGKTLVQPSTHIIGALKKAGAKFQVVGQGKQTYKNLMGSGAVLVIPDMIPHEIQDWEIDRRPVVVQRARIVRERPMLKQWALSFEIEYDDDEIDRNTLKEILDFAGRRVGIGDFRPEKGGPFGRFIVTQYK